MRSAACIQAREALEIRISSQIENRYLLKSIPSEIGFLDKTYKEFDRCRS